MTGGRWTLVTSGFIVGGPPVRSWIVAVVVVQLASTEHAIAFVAGIAAVAYGRQSAGYRCVTRLTRVVSFLRRHPADAGAILRNVVGQPQPPTFDGRSSFSQRERVGSVR
jgi:hypothetical protein